MKDSKNEFRQIFKNIPGFEWCQLMKSASKFSSSIIAKIVITFLKIVAPELIRRCPYPPIRIEKSNRTIPSVITAMLPNGEHRSNFIFRHKNGDVLLNSTITLRIF